MSKTLMRAADRAKSALSAMATECTGESLDRIEEMNQAIDEIVAEETGNDAEDEEQDEDED